MSQSFRHRISPLSHIPTKGAATSMVRVKRYAVNPRVILLQQRQERLRPWIASASLFSFLGAQYLMPGLFTLQSAHAEEVAKRGAALRELKAQAPLRVTARPAPPWYLKQQQKEKAIGRAMYQAQLAPGLYGAGTIARDQDHNVQATSEQQQVVREEALDGDGIPTQGPITTGPFLGNRQSRSSQAGRFKSSAPLYVPNPFTSTKKLNLSEGHDISQREMSEAGQMCGALAPTSDANVPDMEVYGDHYLKQKGLPQGLNTPPSDYTPEGVIVKAAKAKIEKRRTSNRDFGKAIEAWNEHDFNTARERLSDFVKDNPESPWWAEAVIHLADDAKFGGRANEAATFYAQVLQKTSGKPGEMSFEAHQKVKERYADLMIIEGRYDEARPLLADLIQNDLHWRRRTWGSYWLQKLELFRTNTRAGRRVALTLRDCGAQALAAVLRQENRPQEAQKVAALTPSNLRGYSLAELSQVAARHGMPMKGFSCGVGDLASLPLPIILHQKYESAPHYLAGSADDAMQLLARLRWQTAHAKTPLSAARGAANIVGLGLSSERQVQTAPVKVAMKLNPARSRAAAQLDAALMNGAQGDGVLGRAAGHFWVVQHVDATRGVVRVLNPQDGTRHDLTYDQLTREWSGTGLVRSQPATQQVSVDKTQGAPEARITWLSPSAMGQMRGACFVISAQDGLGNQSNNHVICIACMLRSRGQPSISVNSISQNVFITDTPVWHDPAKGPSVDITLSYNSQDGSNYNTIFGNKWSFNYGTSIVVTSGNGTGGGGYLPVSASTTQRSPVAPIGGGGGGRATVFMPDGRQDTYELGSTNGNVTNYLSKIGNFLKLTRTGDYHWELTSQSGAKMIYDIPAGTSGTQPFLVEQRDRWGNSLTIGYNSSSKPVTITDASGGVTRLDYVSTPAGSRVWRVTEPSGRQALFTYDTNGNLSECVDMEGHAFQYTYDSNVNVQELMTAQGPWTFNIQDFMAVEHGGKRVTIYDPLQDKPETFLYRSNINGVVTSEYSYLDHRGNQTFYKVAVILAGTSLYNPGAQTGPIIRPTETYPGSAADAITEIAEVQYPHNLGGTSAYFDANYNSDGYTSGNGSYNSTTLTTLPRVMVSPNNVVTKVIYNVQGSPLAVSRFPGNGYASVYNDNFPNGAQTTTYTYAPNGLDVTDVTNAAGFKLAHLTYNGYHQVTSATINPDQVAGATPATTIPTTTTIYTYNSWGAPLTVTDPQGHVVTYHYYGSGTPAPDLLQSVDRDGVTLGSYTYDLAGRLKTATDATGLTVSYVYNNLNNITHVLFPDGTHADTDYVCCGVPGVTTDRAGRKTYYDYDALKRLVREQDATGNTLQFDYDSDGDMLRMIDGNGKVTRWAYDALKRAVAKAYADGSRSSVTFNGGWVTANTNERGLTTSYARDDLGRVTVINHPDANTPDEGLSYNILNQVTATTLGQWNGQSVVPSASDLGTTSYAYDDLGRVIGVDGPFDNDTISYHYDNLGRNDAMNVQEDANASTTTTYGYDALSRLSTLTSGPNVFDAVGNHTFTYGYDANTQQFTSLTRPNGVVTRYSYTGLEQLQSVVTRVGSSNTDPLVSGYTYAYDNRGVRTGMQQQVGTDPLQTVNWGYDSTNQLTSEQIAQGTNQLNDTFTYDPMGNRQSLTNVRVGNLGGPSGATTSVYNKLNQRVSFTGTQANGTNTPDTIGATYAYDTAGNLTGSSSTRNNAVQDGRAYTYDDLNRLISVVQTSNTGNNLSRTEFQYDGASRLRISRQYTWQNNAWAQQAEKRRVYVGMNVVQERDGNNVTTAELTRDGGIGGILARTRAQGTDYYTYDGRGNVVQLTDSTGATKAAYSYTAFGSPLTTWEAPGVSNPYRYSTKEYYENLGLYDYGFRFYSPALGRWINRDPIRESGGTNLYAMVGNNPVNHRDAHGLMGEEVIAEEVEEALPVVESTLGNIVAAHVDIAEEIGEEIGSLEGELTQAYNGIDRIISPNAAGADEAIPGLEQQALSPQWQQQLQQQQCQGGGPPERVLPIDKAGDAWQHMMDNHFTDIPNKGTFDIDEDYLHYLIENAHHEVSPVLQTIGRLNGNYAWVIDKGTPIGSSIYPYVGETSTFTAITRPSGSFVTAFPGLPNPA